MGTESRDPVLRCRFAPEDHTALRTTSSLAKRHDTFVQSLSSFFTFVYSLLVTANMETGRKKQFPRRTQGMSFYKA